MCVCVLKTIAFNECRAIVYVTIKLIVSDLLVLREHTALISYDNELDKLNQIVEQKKWYNIF